MFGFRKNGKAEGSTERERCDRFKVAAKDETSIGNVLLSLGYLTRDQLNEAIQVQKDNPLGKILLERGAITRTQLDEALLRQRVERGEASDREQTVYHRKEKSRLVTEIQETSRDTSALADAIQAKLQKA